MNRIYMSTTVFYNYGFRADQLQHKFKSPSSKLMIYESKILAYILNRKLASHIWNKAFINTKNLNVFIQV